jgi:hopanoid C-3 methylase
MKILFVHPGPLLYTNVFLRLEPLGLELVAEAARRAGHAVRLVDLQVERHADYHRMIAEWEPDAIAFSCNYLANVPEIVELAKATKLALPRAFICVGGHSASFTASAILEHGAGAIDCVLKGEGEPGIVKLIEAVAGDRDAITKVPGAVTADGEGPRPGFVEHLDEIRPARDLVRHRRKYFIGVLDPCASIEFSRGCPWDCSFCSAWTFYGRSYRLLGPDRVVEDLASIREPGAFIVDDVAFIQQRHGFAIGEAIARNPQELLFGNARRRAAAKQGGIPVLEEDRPHLHLSRHRGDRRGWPAKVSQTHPPWAQFRGAGIRSLIGH